MTTKPNGWQKRHLSDLIQIKHGFAFKGECIDTSGPYVLVTPGNFFEEGGFKRNGEKQKRYSGVVPREYILAPRSLVVAMTEQAEGLLGSAALVPDDEIYLHNQRIGLVTSENTDIGFLYYLFNTAMVRQQIRGSSSGTKVRHTSPSRIGEVAVWLPTREVQSRIAAILSAYDDLIEVNQRRITMLEDMARRLFDDWFVRFRYPGHEDVPLLETEFGTLPEGWRRGTFGECAEVNPETLSPRRAPHEINYIDISSVSVGRVDAVATMEFSHAPGRARRIIRDGDVIWSTVRPNRRSHALLLDVAPNTVASTGFAALRSRNSDWAWIYEATRTDAFVGFLIGRARGSAYPAVVGADFEDVPLIVPPLALRLAFQKQVGPMHELASTLDRQNNELRAARNLLLPKLISGEIDVSFSAQTFAEAAE